MTTGAHRRKPLPGRIRAGVLLLGLILIIPALTHRAAAEPLFGLPLPGPASPSTWFVSQWYGNTLTAYRNWPDLYAAGQGLHFGIDFAAPCGTPVLAIGDGVIYAVDGPFGSAPHNVVVDHRNGYLSLYGHLLERSPLRSGQEVKRGDVIGRTGDPASPACDAAPHLHLEVRRTGMGIAVNPIPLIDADWRALAIGARTDGTRFVLDYDQPGRWMTIADQPEVRFGGPVVNQYPAAWPTR